ncbi:hypothetical protein R3W88_032989 [Solanum pinnatisectum]|uniref:Gag-pol polyprotein n=1 Tax=Solanum pinnatisectum TaxID=50273 RepID=A0AAV9K5J0_9SOLN|nr:hypothetical protein R3W88_032989 [Solanum pinnatisectum]
MTVQTQAVTTQDQALTAQVNQEVEPQVNPNASTPTSRIRDFTRMNRPTFHGSKVDEDPQGFIDEVFKVVDAMEVSSREKMELTAYQLKDVAQVLMTYVQQIEEIKLRKTNREAKRTRPDEQSQPRSKKRYYNQESSIVNNDRVSNPKSQGGNGSGSSFEMSECAKCGKQHLGKCLAGTDGCFGCGKKGHKMRGFPTLSAQGRESKQASHDVPDHDAPKRNHFYVLQANKNKGANPNEVTGK